MSTERDHIIAYIDGKRFDPKTAALELAGINNVEVQLDYEHSRLWVNTGAGCALRIYGIRGHLQFNDLRDGPQQWIAWYEREKSWARANGRPVLSTEEEFRRAVARWPSD